MRAAAIDVGTNTLLLSIAERHGESIVPLLERATITRLGKGIDRTRVLDPDAARRTLSALREFAEEIRTHGVAQTLAVGTSALRDARGADEFLSSASKILGTPIEVVSGAEEAMLSFTGAVSGLELEGDVVVFDIGGGSTEIGTGTVRSGMRSVTASWSLDIGTVRSFERHIRSDPPRASELDAVAREITEALAGIPRPSAVTLVGVAGTMTTLAAVDRGVAHAPGALHGAMLSSERVRDLASELAAKPLSERLLLPGLEPGRADVIVTGAVIAREIVAWCNTNRVVVSDRGVRWGLLERLLAE